jgi:NADH-quinone oxidoreductase subunit G
MAIGCVMMGGILTNLSIATIACFTEKEKMLADGLSSRQKKPPSTPERLLQKTSASQVAVVVTGHATVEEYEFLVKTFLGQVKTSKIYHWLNNKETVETFDGLLIRGDKNPNTKGLLKVLEKNNIQTSWNLLEADLKNGQIETLVVVGPENTALFPDLEKNKTLFGQAKNLIWLTSSDQSLNQSLNQPGAEAQNQSRQMPNNVWLIPMKTYVEKAGTFVNYAGLEQKFTKVTTVVNEALTVIEACQLLTGLASQQTVNTSKDEDILIEDIRPIDRVVLEHRKKNEFVFKKGSL